MLSGVSFKLRERERERIWGREIVKNRNKKKEKEKYIIIEKNWKYRKSVEKETQEKDGLINMERKRKMLIQTERKIDIERDWQKYRSREKNNIRDKI